jgi:hypothetical protein
MHFWSARSTGTIKPGIMRVMYFEIKVLLPYYNVISNCSNNCAKQLYAILFDPLARLLVYNVMMDHNYSYTFCIHLSSRFEGLKLDMKHGWNVW